MISSIIWLLQKLRWKGWNLCFVSNIDISSFEAPVCKHVFLILRLKSLFWFVRCVLVWLSRSVYVRPSTLFCILKHGLWLRGLHRLISSSLLHFGFFIFGFKSLVWWSSALSWLSLCVLSWLDNFFCIRIGFFFFSLTWSWSLRSGSLSSLWFLLSVLCLLAFSLVSGSSVSARGFSILYCWDLIVIPSRLRLCLGLRLAFGPVDLLVSWLHLGLGILLLAVTHLLSNVIVLNWFVFDWTALSRLRRFWLVV